MEEVLDCLDAASGRIGLRSVPIPFNKNFEKWFPPISKNHLQG